MPATLTEQPNTKMAQKTSREMPHATCASNLLSDISPELALRWTAAEAAQADSAPSHIPSCVMRGLLSTMLRAATTHDREQAEQVLQAVLMLPVQSPSAPVGFPPDANPAAIADVLTDLVASAARDEPLLPNNPALTYFADAGPGAGDVGEYHVASGEFRVAFAEQKERLANVRTANLAAVLCYYAEIMERGGKSGQLLSDAVSRNRTVWLAPFTDVLPNTVLVLNSSLREGLRRLYAAYMGTRNSTERSLMGCALATTFMQLFSKVDSLGLYVESIADPKIKYAACRLCLTQRFGVKDNIEKPLSLRILLDKYLSITPAEGRPNAAVPALMSGLLIGWYQTVSADAFRLPVARTSADSSEKLSLEYLNALTLARRRFCSTKVKPSFGGSKKDNAMLKTTIMTIAHEILYSN